MIIVLVCQRLKMYHFQSYTLPDVLCTYIQYIYIPHSYIRIFIQAYTCTLTTLLKVTTIGECKKNAQILLAGNVGHYANEAVLSGTLQTLS